MKSVYLAVVIVWVIATILKMWFASAIYGEAHMIAGDTTTISGGDDGDKGDDDDGDDN